MYPHNVMWVHKLRMYVVGVDRYLPWQQLVDPADGVIGDSFQDVLEIDLRVKAVELG